MTTRIGVMVRFRPQLDTEKKKGYPSQKLQVLDETEEVMLINKINYFIIIIYSPYYQAHLFFYFDDLIQFNKLLSYQQRYLQIVNANDYNGNKCYQFTKVITESTNQKQCFDQTQLPEMINKVVEGFHSTIFAYGQTGSGKTYTMEGISYENHGKGLKPQIESEVNQILKEEY